MDRKKIVYTAIGIAIILAGGFVAFAGFDDPAPPEVVPLQIPYQGVLERDGVLVDALGADTVDFLVSLWDAPENGSQVWPAAGQTERHTLNVHRGRFSLVLGSTVPLTHVHVDNNPLYLDLQVQSAGDASPVQLAGRQRIMSSPYAIRAYRSMYARNSDTADLANAVATSAFTISTRYEACAFGPNNSEYVSMGSNANRVCFLTGSGPWLPAGCAASDFGNSCTVRESFTGWELIAWSINNCSNAGGCCYATCLIW